MYFKPNVSASLERRGSKGGNDKILFFQNNGRHTENQNRIKCLCLEVEFLQLKGMEIFYVKTMQHKIQTDYLDLDTFQHYILSE